MLLVAIIWVLLGIYALARARHRAEPPFWWVALAIANIVASIALGIDSVL